MGKEFVVDGKRLVLTRASKEFTCVICKQPIKAGSKYFKVTFNGSGLRNIKFPDRTHENNCIDEFMRRYKSGR